MEAQVQKLAAAYLEDVRPTGEDGLRATCPLCDSTRAFIISTQHGGWLCFSCGERGALVTLLRALGMGRKQVDRMVNAMRLAPPIPEKVKRKRALREGWSLLPEYILAAYDNVPPELIELGYEETLLRRHDVGLDKTNNRITFAVRDLLGRLVGISGRARTDRQLPRYKVYDAEPSRSPPRPPPHRAAGEFHGAVDNYAPDIRKHLYGFNDVYPERFFKPKETHPPLVITEGYKSTLWLRQLGFSHAVGLQGSSMTSAQRRHLGKLRGPYYIMLDNEAGKAFPDKNRRCAALDIARRLRRSGRVFVCVYPKETPVGTAPDDIGNAEEIGQIINTAKTMGQLFIRGSTT